eukprot:g13064.t1
MTDAARDEENATAPVQLPLFVGSSASTKARGRTYSLPKEAKKKRRSVGGDGTNKKRKSSKSRRRRSIRGGDGVPRCALQTLGGRCTAGPLKGGLSNSNEATLKKNKGYGGKWFFDECYLSSDDDDDCAGAASGTRQTPTWALSPPIHGDESAFRGVSDAGGNGTKSKKIAKNTSKKAAAVPSSGFIPLPMSSPSSSSSGRRGANISRRTSGRRQSRLDLGRFSGGEDDDGEEGESLDARSGAGDDDGHDACDDSSGDDDWEMATTIANTKAIDKKGGGRSRSRRSERSERSTPTARQSLAAPESSKLSRPAGRKTTKANPFRARGGNASAANIVAESSPIADKKPPRTAPAAAPAGGGGVDDGTEPLRKRAPPPASRRKGHRAFGAGTAGRKS